MPREAIAGLGNLRRLALDYLDAEYGEGRPRPQMLKGHGLGHRRRGRVDVALIVGFDSFLDGLEAGSPGSGHVRLGPGAGFLGQQAEVTYDDEGFAGST